MEVAMPKPRIIDLYEEEDFEIINNRYVILKNGISPKKPQQVDESEVNNEDN